MDRRRRTKRVLALGGAVAVPTLIALVACEHAKYWRGGEPFKNSFVKEVMTPEGEARELVKLGMAPPAPPPGQSAQAVFAKSEGCMSCHGATDESDMHAGSEVAIGCVDCHGGDATVRSTLAAPGRPGTPGEPINEEAYLKAMLSAHVPPRNPGAWYGQPTLRYGDHHDHDPARLHGSRNPEVAAGLLLQESPAFVRFINPGDLRVAALACGACHPREVANVGHSMMSHGAQLWSAALYNNGSIPNKVPRYGEGYTVFGLPARLQGAVKDASWNAERSRLDITMRAPTSAELTHSVNNGLVPALDPLPVWNISQPGNVLRIFERGTKLPVPGGPTPNPPPQELGNPNPLAEGGRPDKGLSVRGLGTLNRTDPVFLGLQKTRLLDPILPMIGTNDHPGDFRSSGCTACHVVYANDRESGHSGAYASSGNRGTSQTIDPTIPKGEPGHPVRHAFTNAIPSSQCVVCHMHPGTSFANQYLGYTWWDNESDGRFMYPARSARPTAEQRWVSLRKNPDDAAVRGLWGNLYPGAVSHAGDAAPADFLEQSGEPRKGDGSTLNDRMEHNQFADFHGHGWVFRAIHKKDRQGKLLDRAGNPIDPNDPEKWNKAVHLSDVHQQADPPMHCVDCHFQQDVHGDGNLYGEVRNAIEVTCQDCHGTYTEKAEKLFTSGPAAPDGTKGPGGRGTNLSSSRIGPKGQARFEWEDGRLYQRSALEPDKRWEVVQVVDTIDPDSSWSKANPEAARLSRYAKTVQKRSGQHETVWGDMPPPADHARLAHPETAMQCYTCHTAWVTSCFGCHLPMQANERTPMFHNESLYTRNFTRYNFQVLRDDVFMLGRDSTVKGNKIVPVRSSSAVVVSSQNANREWVYHQQQTVSGEGYSGQAFNPHFPHATGGRGTTKMCTDCHVSREGDNNAWMAQLLLQGTNFVNFFGRYVYVAEGDEGLEAVAVTEHDEPQAVYGSPLHELAFPDEFASFVEGGRQLREQHHHDGKGSLALISRSEILDLQVRGEYLYAARGRAGFYAFDIANIDNKGFSERIITAPVSPLGQRLGFDTKNCVAIASPSTLAVDPARSRHSSDPSQPRRTIMDPAEPHHVNQEQAVHPLYAFLYIGDAEEGLILTNAATLLDGDPTNNFMSRAELEDGTTAFNPSGALSGLTSLVLAGHHIYATATSGLVVIDIDKPLSPRIVATVGTDVLTDPRSVAIQFRYAFVTDSRGLNVIDITDPSAPRPVAGARMGLASAQRVYVARTYAFVAAGKQGLAIIDVTRPETPALIEYFTADGAIDDARDVKVGMTNASLFAYIADGRNGMRVVHLMGPDSTAQFRGFSPPLAPRLIATAKTHGPALAVSKGLDRDRAVDETGHQVAVFGRIGARPLNAQEMGRMYLDAGRVWTVTDAPDSQPQPFTRRTEEEEKPGPRRPRR